MLSEGDILNGIYDIDGGEKNIYGLGHTIVSVTDAGGNPVTLPITAPGKYTVKVALSEEALADGYRYNDGGDTFEISVFMKDDGYNAIIDYVNEQLIVKRMNDEFGEFAANPGEVLLTFKLDEKAYTVEGAFAKQDVFAIDLSELGEQLGVTLPSEDENGSYEINIVQSIPRVTNLTCKQVIPGRPHYVETECGVNKSCGDIYVQVLNDYSKYSVGIKPKGAAGDEPTIIGKESDHSGAFGFHNLSWNTEYAVYLCIKATENSFRSAWHNFDTVTTEEGIYLNAGTKKPIYKWTPGFSLDEDAIKESIRFTYSADGTPCYGVYDYEYTIEVSNAGGKVTLSIKEPGSYTVKLVKTEYWNTNFDLASDTFDIVVTTEAGDAVIGYENETLAVYLPENMRRSMARSSFACSITFSLNGRQYNVPNAFEDGFFSIYLSELGEQLGAALPDDNRDMVLHIMITAGGVTGSSYDFTIPRRPEYNWHGGAQQPTQATGWTSVIIKGVAQDYESGLRPKDGSPKEGPTIIGTESEDGQDIVFEGLNPGTGFYHYMRNKATSERFCSVWHKQLAMIFTLNSTELSAETGKSTYQWTLGFSLDEDDIRSTIVSTEVESGESSDYLWYTDYAIAVFDAESTDGEELSLPLTDSGTYTVVVRISKDSKYFGRYAFAEGKDAFNITILPPKSFAGTVSMSGYVYGDTPSQPRLNGYEGSGNVTFFYRAVGANDWLEWKDISPTTLTPGNYEIMARVEAAGEYEGGETAAVKFTVSENSAGMYILMNDYTYGGTVPEPQIVNGGGLNAEWSYMGADGVEHSWANITGTTLPAGSYTMIAHVNSATLMTGFTVMRASAPAIQWPTAGSIAYGQRLGEAKLSADADEHGRFAWANPDELLGMGDHMALITYTPYDTANYDYSGIALSKKISVTVEGKDIGGDGITIVDIPNQTYTGKPIEPEVTIKDGSKTLVNGKDYTVTYTGNTDSGKANVVITGKGEYGGTTTVTFDILPKDFDKGGITVSRIPAQDYTGKPIEPEVTVKDGGKLLTEGEDYTVSYTDNVDEGKATVIITGMGNYGGTVDVEFVIRDDSGDDDDGDDDDEDGDDDGGEDGDEDSGKDDDGKTEAEKLLPDEYADKLVDGEYVEGTLTDREGMPQLYEVYTEEVHDENGEVIKRTLVISALPLMDENDEPVLRKGEPIYEQRNLHLSGGLLDALEGREYTHIRFELNEAALEWAIADMQREGNVVRIAPMENDELSRAERKAIGEAEQLTGSYRARITAMIDGEAADVTNAMPSLTAAFEADNVRALDQDEAAQLLTVPGDGEPEARLSEMQLTKTLIAGDEDEYARYEARLDESGLFLIILK